MDSEAAHLNSTALREFRKMRSLSIRGLARSVGIEHSYLSRIETGERQPTPGVVQRLARELAIPVAAVVCSNCIEHGECGSAVKESA